MCTNVVGSLPACLNQVMLGMEQCILAVMIVLMVLIFVILVLQCVLIMWALTCSGKSGYARNGTLCADNSECVDGTHNRHPCPAMCAC